MGEQLQRSGTDWLLLSASTRAAMLFRRATWLSIFENFYPPFLIAVLACAPSLQRGLVDRGASITCAISAMRPWIGRRPNVSVARFRLAREDGSSLAKGGAPVPSNHEACLPARPVAGEAGRLARAQRRSGSPARHRRTSRGDPRPALDARSSKPGNCANVARPASRRARH
jgi:hypothetical protein